MSVEVKIPAVGESVQEGMIESWHKRDGDVVVQDEVLFGLETDKATVEVVAEVAGVLRIHKEVGAVVRVGEVVAVLEAAGAGGEDGLRSPPEPSPPGEAQPVVEAARPGAAGEPPPDDGPAVRKILADAAVRRPSDLRGQGKDGRLTKLEAIDWVQKQQQVAAVDAPAGRSEERKAMSMMRRRIAERLVEAQATAAILTTFNEVDMSQVMALRGRYKEVFQQTHDVKLGFMGFFLKACVEALQAFPAVNAYVDGTDMVYHNYCDIGVAVQTPKGLMVPVVRGVEHLSVAQIEAQIADYAAKARAQKIGLGDLTGGTFTVSNGGVFGSLLSTPILNPPQSGILGMHKTQMRPVVLEDGNIVGRPMMYLALSYDHRIIDGKEAVGFLVKVKECIEDPSRMLLGV